MSRSDFNFYQLATSTTAGRSLQEPSALYGLDVLLEQIPDETLASQIRHQVELLLEQQKAKPLADDGI